MYSTGKLNRLKLGTQGLTPNMALCLSTAQVLLEDFDVFYQFLRKLYFFCQDIVKDCCKRNICDLGFLVPGGIRISKEFWGFPNFLRIFKVLIFSDFKVGCTWFPKLNAPRLILGIIALNKGLKKKKTLQRKWIIKLYLIVVLLKISIKPYDYNIKWHLQMPIQSHSQLLTVVEDSGWPTWADTLFTISKSARISEFYL